MNFEIQFDLNGKVHHTRAFDEPHHASEAMLNWERFGTHHSSKVIEGDAALVGVHYHSKLSSLILKHGNKGPVVESPDVES